MELKAVADHSMLSNRYSNAKRELDEAERSLRKLLGNTRSEFSGRPVYQTQHTQSSGKNLPSQQTSAKRPKPTESIEESQSEDEQPSKKAALQSAVIAKLGGAKSRKDLICRQNPNPKLQSRNRRILGMLQSTLRKFQDEEVKRQPQDSKRLKVLEKVEAAEKEEKEQVEKQKLELLSKTKEKQLELNCLEKMMRITESFELWENNQKYLLNFNVTKTEPRICFMPATPTPSSKNHLEKSRVEIKEKIEARKEIVEMTLANITESYQVSTTHSTVEESTSDELDNFQKTSMQVKESCTTEQESEVPEEVLSSDLSEDESDFLVKMLY